MNNLKGIAIERLVKQLQNLNVQLHIITEDGVVFGAPIVPPKPPRAPKKVLNKGITSYTMPLLSGMKPGDTVDVPIGNYDMHAIQASAAAVAHKLWGNGTYLTQRGKGVVTVLRVE